MKQVLQSLKDGSTQLADVPSLRAASGQLLIHTSATLVSAGTERMLIEFGKAAGGDGEVVRQHASRLSPTCEVPVLGYLPIADMIALYRRAMVTCYLTCDQTFRHKVVELLCCGRPILCFPADQAEALTLTQRVGGNLRSCTSPADIVNGLVHAEATLNAAGRASQRTPS